jgi:uncharacterized protein (DUF1501 family)
VLERHPIEMSCHLDISGQSALTGRTIDISASGARITGVKPLSIGTRGQLHLAGLPQPLAFVVEDSNETTTRVSFHGNDTASAAFGSFLARLATKSAA